MDTTGNDQNTPEQVRKYNLYRIEGEKQRLIATRREGEDWQYVEGERA